MASYRARMVIFRGWGVTYIGEDIGEQGGDGDTELEKRVAEKRGRHVMQQGRRETASGWKIWANRGPVCELGVPSAGGMGQQCTHLSHGDDSSDEDNQAGY